ncbi:hypothetical protein [Salinimicrobium xinjiangense]|uniref:hypothetical protein n=1 Tax=Salinimicrobium xinjiangense TaxID=438596 RepID=UPI00040AC7B2|nr:hypothetical protein [Salinimicrobium xinjiangense]
MQLKISKPLLMLALLLSLFSCSEDEVTPEEKGTEKPEEVMDSYNYIALRNDGTLFSIGDQTGKVSMLGKIPGVEFNVMFNSITSSSSKIYIYEHYFDPPRGVLYAWDKLTANTRSAVLDFPAEFGDNTALISLDWDEENQNLVGITREDIEQSGNNKPIKVVRIDPENFEITTTPDIDLATEAYTNVYSTSLVGQKLYAVGFRGSQWNPNLLEIDLDQNSFKVVPVSGIDTGFTNLGNSGSANSIFGFSPVANSDYMAEVRPVTYNIQTGTIRELEDTPRISALNFSHKTFFNSDAGEFAELVGSGGKIHLFKFKPSSGNFEITEIVSPDILMDKPRLN